jgi:hypothetical protein
MARSRKRFNPPTTRRRLGALTASQERVYGRALHALRLSQNAGMSVGQAAREAGTTVASMRRYLGDAIEKRDRRWHAKARNRLWRYVRVPTESGMQRLAVSGRDADLARSYRDALWRYVHFDDDTGLAGLDGRSIGGCTLETDPARISELIDRGELDPSEIGSGETGR